MSRVALISVGLLVCIVPDTALAVCGSGSTIGTNADAQARHRRAIEVHRRVTDAAFRSPISSPLLAADFEQFDGLNYFPIDGRYARFAQFTSRPGSDIFELPTFNGDRQRYVEFGRLSFCAFSGPDATLMLYQRQDRGDAGKLTVIAPFRDTTNGVDTYSGGRYLKFLLPLSDPPQIDFNRAVNPFCAYNPNLPCPIPPKANWLPFPVAAGEKGYKAAKNQLDRTPVSP
jgi:uncharacterized protein (DUF1684 family)